MIEYERNDTGTAAVLLVDTGRRSFEGRHPSIGIPRARAEGRSSVDPERWVVSRLSPEDQIPDLGEHCRCCRSFSPVWLPIIVRCSKCLIMRASILHLRGYDNEQCINVQGTLCAAYYVELAREPATKKLQPFTMSYVICNVLPVLWHLHLKFHTFHRTFECVDR